MTIRAGEDALRIRRAHEGASSPLGCGVAVASDRKEGVAAERSRALDMIVVEPDMPGMDGIGFIRALRQTPPDRRAPIVMLAVESDKGLRPQANKGLKPQAKAAGPTGCLANPFKAEQPIAANQKVLG